MNDPETKNENEQNINDKELIHSLEQQLKYYKQLAQDALDTLNKQKQHTKEQTDDLRNDRDRLRIEANTSTSRYNALVHDLQMPGIRNMLSNVTNGQYTLSITYTFTPPEQKGSDHNYDD